jgi:hypothetical protein
MINKEISIVLTQAEIDSPEDIQIKFHVHSEDDLDNEEGVTYTIMYPKPIKQ